MTLSEFLLARIAEDEQSSLHEGAARHAKQRAECEAKRRIIELADAATTLDIEADMEFGISEKRNEATDPYLGDQILAALAAIYADHPDFRTEWPP